MDIAWCKILKEVASYLEMDYQEVVKELFQKD